MNRINQIALLFLFVLQSIECNDAPEIATTQGIVRGKISQGKGGFEYHSFVGIPYAKPPVGELRFRDPVPAEPWDGVFDATKDGTMCAQNDVLFADKTGGVEDCLILNVHTPKTALTEPEPLAVMVFFHGGGFIIGSGDISMYGPQFLLMKDVIVVTFNYRLAVLGFLNLDIPEIPGNAGLKDQLLVLRWVKDNIKNFGGDPDKVTIFGGSAGASAVGYHLVSPTTKGFFNRAIVQSGSPLIDHSVPRDHEKYAANFLKGLNLDPNNKEEMLKGLATASLEDIYQFSQNNYYRCKFTRPFGPSIEKSFPGVENFITEHPLAILQAGKHNKVPVIVGTTNNEGINILYLKLKVTQDYKTLEEIYPDDFKDIIPYIYMDVMDEQTIKNVGEQIKELYSSGDEHVLQKYANLMGFASFAEGAHHLAELMSPHAPVYCYRFNYKGSRNVFQPITPYTYKGASHFDELGYMFSMQMFSDDIDEKDQTMMDHVVHLWTIFAKYGVTCHNYNWPAMTKDDTKCIILDETVQVSDDPFSESEKFWINLRRKYF